MPDSPAIPQSSADQSDDWNRLALDAASLGTWRHDFAADVIRLDARSQSLWGFDRQDVKLADVVARIHPDDRGQVLALGDASPRDPSGDATVAGEFRIVRPDGDVRWLSIRGRLYFDGAGAKPGPVLSIGVYLDVTGPKRAEEALRTSEARFRAFIDLATDAFFLLDPGGRIVDVNRQACHSLGYTRDELIGMTPREIDPDAGPTTVEQLTARLDAGETVAFDTRHRRKDGSVFPVEVHARRITLEGRRYGLALVRDITERKRAEGALRRSEQLLRLVLDTLPVGVLVVDAAGDVILGNPASQRIWGGLIRDGAKRYARSKAWWHETGEPVEPGEWASVRALTAGETSINDLIDIEGFDGARKTIQNSAVPFGDAQQAIAGAVVVNEDVTERVQLEGQVRQAQKMEAVGQLAGGVAHDFNNLIGAIRVYGDLLVEVPPLSATHEYVAGIREAANRAARLTDQLLAFSRKAIVAPQVLDLNEVIESVAQLLRRLIGDDVELTTLLNPDVSRVRLDPGQLDQIVMNLAVNARDAMPTGGRLTIQTREVVVRPGDFAGSPDFKAGPYVELAVADTGHGMTAEVQARIFEPFFTTKEIGKGTGLGLATVFGIVKQAGGQISVESQAGAGTKFIILLPALPAEISAAAPPTPPPQATPRGSATVLLVEDNDLVRASTRLLLMRQGYTVIEARSGAEAVRAAEGDQRPIHLLLTDVVMPGIGGKDVAEAVRRRRPDVKVLYMSGYTDDAVIRHGVSRATDAFLQKPFTLPGLAGKIQQVLESHTQ